jgi:hypothetical protein
MLHLRRYLAVMLATILLAACGGHGGSGSVTPPTTEVSSSQNAQGASVSTQTVTPAPVPTNSPYVYPCPSGGGDCVILAVGQSITIPFGGGDNGSDVCTPVMTWDISPNNVSATVAGGDIGNGQFKATITITGEPAMLLQPTGSGASVIANDNCNFSRFFAWHVIPYVAPSPAPMPTATPTPTPTKMPTPSPTLKPTAKPCTKPATPGPIPLAPVAVKDQLGSQIIGADGLPVFRPDDGHDPAFFAKQGESVGSIPGLENLSDFRHGGVWDEQRVGGLGVISGYVNWATIAMGIYAASNDIPESLLDLIQSEYAQKYSHFGEGVIMDKNYPSLPATNVKNLDIGYAFYKNNPFSLCP